MLRIRMVLLFMMTCLAAGATGAYPYPVTVRQGDGAFVRVVLHGDEFCRWTTNIWGHAVKLDSDGCWRTVQAPSASELAGVRRFNMERMMASSTALTAGPLRCAADTVKDVRVLVIPVQFSDVSFLTEDCRTHLERKLNAPGYSEDGATGSAKDYFEANFRGYAFTFDVCEPVTLGHEASYYGGNDESVPSQIRYDVNMPYLVREACRKIDSDVDFSDYDQDGDGFIDHLVFVYAGHNEAEGGGPDTIWSHQWNLESEKLRFDGVYVGLYAAAPELRGASGSDDAGIGTFCHELSHTFGLKDLYDVNYGGDGLSNCLWHTLSLMDYGNFNNDGRTPPCYCAIDRELAGIADIFVPAEGDDIILEPAGSCGRVCRIDTEKEGEYFLFEARDESGWDRFIGGHGMLVYHIDKSDRYVSGIQASVRWVENLVNTVSGHECADLVEAIRDAGAVSQIFFPGQGAVDEFGPMSVPALESWDGESLMLKLCDIREEGSCVAFSVRADSSERMLRAVRPAVTPYQRDAVLRWSSEKENAIWGVRWHASASGDFDVVRIQGLECRLSPLEPATEYEAEIFHIGRSGYGDTTAVRFSTSAYTSAYPVIYAPGSFCRVGESIELRVLNIQEDAAGVQWYVDDLKMDTDRLVPLQAGTLTVRAEINYLSDGSTEIITRTFTVREADDE